jgi:hypothetical protein
MRDLVCYLDRNAYAVDAIAAHTSNNFRYFAYFPYRVLGTGFDVDQALGVDANRGIVAIVRNVRRSIGY